MIKTLTALLFLATVANATSQVERVETRVVNGIHVKDIFMKNRKTSIGMYVRLDNPHNRNIDKYEATVKAYNVLNRSLNATIDKLNKTTAISKRETLIGKMNYKQKKLDILAHNIDQLQKAIESTK